MLCSGLQGLRFGCLIEDAEGEGQDEEVEEEADGAAAAGVVGASAACASGISGIGAADATTAALASASAAGDASESAPLPLAGGAVGAAGGAACSTGSEESSPACTNTPAPAAAAAAVSVGVTGAGAAASSTPDTGIYDVVWLQWVIGCVLDTDLVALLKSAAACLTPTGIIVIKDNTAREGDAFVYDNEDHSIARSERYLHAVFRRAGLAVLEDMPVPGWEEDLLPVRMYALRRREAPVDVARRKLQAARAAAAASQQRSA